MPKEEELKKIKSEKLQKEAGRREEDKKKEEQIKAGVTPYLNELSIEALKETTTKADNQGTYVRARRSAYVSLWQLGNMQEVTVPDPEKKVLDGTMNYAEFSKFFYDTVGFKLSKTDAEKNMLTKAMFNLLLLDEDGAASELVKSHVIKRYTHVEQLLRTVLLAVEGKEDTLSENDKKSLEAVKLGLQICTSITEADHKVQAAREILMAKERILDDRMTDLKKFRAEDDKAREEAIANYKEGDPVKVYIRDVWEFVQAANKENRLDPPMSENEVNEKMAMCTSDAERMEFYQNLIVKDKCCKLWEYPKNGEYKNYLTPELRNSNNANELKSYYMKNLKTLHFIEKAQLLKRIHALDLATKIQKANESGKLTKEDLGNAYYPSRKYTVKENGNVRMTVSLADKQTADDGCWSCGYELMLASHGINVRQEEIRAMRSTFGEEDKKKKEFESVDEQYHSDRGKDISAMADSVLPFAPDKMIRSFEIANPLTISMSYGADIEINREKYIDAATQEAEKKIRQILNEDKSTISFTDGSHYYAITDMRDDGYIYCIDSMTGIHKNLKLRDMIANTFEGAMGDPQEFTLVWMSDLELDPKSRTFYNVPSHYLSVNEDGSLNLPPEHEHNECEGEKSSFEKNGIRVKMVGGVDDTAYDRINRNPFGKNNILITERAYLPKKLNYASLKRKADARTPGQTKELESRRDNLLGKNFVPPKRDPKLTEKDMNKAVEDWLKEKAKKGQELELADRVNRFNEFHNLKYIPENELRNEEGKEYLWNKTGAFVAFKIEKSYHAMRQFITYMKEHDKPEKQKKWSSQLEELEKGYDEFRKKIHAPENAITDEVKPDVYTLPGYLKSNADIVWGLNFMNSIAGKITPSDFGSTRAKYTRYENYNPNLLIRFGENIREFAEEDSKCNLLKECATNPEFNEAVNLSLIMPSDQPEVLNTKFKTAENPCLKEYTDFSLAVTKGIIANDMKGFSEKVTKFKDLVKGEDGKIFPAVRDYALTGKLENPGQQYDKPVVKEEPKEENKNEIKEEPQEEKALTAFEKFKLAYKNGTLFTAEEREKINRVCAQIKELEENELKDSYSLQNRMKSGREDLEFLANVNPDTYEEDVWEKKADDLYDFAVALGEKGYQNELVHLEGKKQPPFGKDLKELFEVINLVTQKTNIDDPVDEIIAENKLHYGELTAQYLLPHITDEEIEGLGTEILPPEFIAYKNAEELSDEQLEKAEKAFDTIFKDVVDREWFDLTAFKAKPRSSDSTFDYNIVKNTGTKRDIQVGKAEILCAMLNSQREVTYEKKYLDKNEQKQRLYVKIPHPALTQQTLDAQKKFKEDFTNGIFGELKKITDSEEISRNEIKYGCAPDGVNGEFPFDKILYEDREALMQGAKYFDEVFKPVSDKCLPVKENVIRSFKYLGEPVENMVDSALRMANKAPSHSGELLTAITKNYVLFLLGKGDEGLTFAPRTFDAETGGFHDYVEREEPVKLRVTQVEIRKEQARLEEEKRRADEEKKRADEEAKEKARKAEEEKQRLQKEEEERKKSEELAKQNEEENARIKEEYQNNINNIEEQFQENQAKQEQLYDEKTAEFLAYQNDYKDAKYTRRNLSLPEKDAETYLDRFKAEDYLDLSTQQKKAEVSQILKNAGVADAADPKVLSSLVVLYALGVKNMKLNDFEKLSAEEKKQLGTDMLKDFRDRPVMGTLPGSREKAEENLSWYGKMVGTANNTWYHRSLIDYPDPDKVNTEKALYDTLKNDKFGLAYDLSGTIPKLSANWENRSSKPTAENPYGIDFGYTFGSKYAGKSDDFANLDAKTKDSIGFTYLREMIDGFRSIYHNDPSNPYQNRMKVVRYRTLKDFYQPGMGGIDSPTSDSGNYDFGMLAKGKINSDYPDSYMKILDQADEKNAGEILKHNLSENGSNKVPENLKKDNDTLKKIASKTNVNEYLTCGIEIQKDFREKMQQINESDHSEILTLPFNSPENVNKEPDYKAMMEDDAQLQAYEKVFDRIFNPILYMQKRLTTVKANAGSRIYNDIGVNFTVDGKSVKDLSEEKTGIPDHAYEYSDIKKRIRIAKVIVLHEMAKEGSIITYVPVTTGTMHSLVNGEAVEVKNFTHAMKAEMDATRQALSGKGVNRIDEDIIPKSDNNDFIIENSGNNINNNINNNNIDNNNIDNNNIDNNNINNNINDDINNIIDNGENEENEFVAGLSGQEHDPNEQIIALHEGDVPHVEEHKSAYVLYGGISAFREALKRDLESYKALLEGNENLFISHGVTDPNPADYQNVKEALNNCMNTLNDENATLDNIRRSFDMFNLRTMQYSSNHREFILSHRTAESADRHRIISGIADLNDVHMKLFDDMKGRLDETVAVFHQDGDRFKSGRLTMGALKNVLEGQDNVGDPNPDVLRYYGIQNQRNGKILYAGMKKKQETKMLYDRYGRKTGLKNEERRNELVPLKGSHTARDYAKNYLAIKYRDKIRAIENNHTVKDLIDVNEPIREKPYKKEIDSLENDFYFTRIVSTEKNWVNRWKETEEKSERVLAELEKNARVASTTGINKAKSEIIALRFPENNIEEAGNNNIEQPAKNAIEKRIAEHVPVAKLLLSKVLTKPENRELLHAFADMNPKVQAYVIRDVADYIQNVEPLPQESNRLAADLESKLKGSALNSGVAHRIKNCFEEMVFEALDNRKAKKQSVPQQGEKKEEGPAIGKK